MASPMIDAALTPLRMTASGLVKAGNGLARRVICAASTSGTLTIYDNTAASGTIILNAFPLSAGQSYQLDALFQNGCYVALGGTADITFLYY